MTVLTKRIRFKGTVQGVGFRYTSSRIAKTNQLTGQVRNMPDGSVEMIAQGSPRDIQQTIEDIKQTFSGYIRDIETEDISHNCKFDDFRITF